MSHSFRRHHALAGLAAFGALVAAAPAAQAAQLTTNITCDFPLTGASGFKFEVSANDGKLFYQLTSLPDASGTDAAFTGLKLVKAAKLTGDTVTANITQTDLASSAQRTAPTTISGTTVPAAPPLVIQTAADYPNTVSDVSQLTLDSVDLALRPVKADGTPVIIVSGGIGIPEDAGLINVHCTVDPGQPTSFPRNSPMPTISPVPTATPVVTPVPATPTPVVTPKPIAYSYSLAGAATLKTLTKGSLPLAGTADAKLVLASGDFTAALSLAQTQGNLVALGFLPVAATVQIVPQGDATGTLKDSGLTVNTKVRIKLPKVTLFGLQLGGGSGCQAKNISAITLKSPGEFSPLDGGTISGTFTISDLVNCGALNGIISPLTAGSGNAIALKLTPKS